MALLLPLPPLLDLPIQGPRGFFADSDAPLYIKPFLRAFLKKNEVCP